MKKSKKKVAKDKFKCDNCDETFTEMPCCDNCNNYIDEDEDIWCDRDNHFCSAECLANYVGTESSISEIDD